MKIAFIIFLILHAGIHLIAFSKEFWLLGTQSLVALSKSPGIVWLLTSVLLITTALLVGLNYNYWWAFGVVSILLSQIIIFTSWTETKYGTIPNILILFSLIAMH